MDVLVELERRSSQIEILAVELSSAVEAADLVSASRRLRVLRDELELTATTLHVLIANAALVDAAAPGGRLIPLSPALPADLGWRVEEVTADAVRAEDPTLVEQDHQLAERLINILVLTANLKHAMTRLRREHVVNGLLQVEEICHFVQRRIARLNAAWLWGKRNDARGALAEAVASLRAISEHRGIVLFLRDAARMESDAVRAVARQLAEQLGITLEVS